MKLSIFLPIVLVSGQTGNWDMTPSYNDKDNWPQNSTGMGQLFHTMEYFPEPIEVEFRGRIPNWITGSFYRNGPGIYEWGDRKFEHFFDPTAVLQAIHIKDSKFTYHSNIIKSRNYHANKDAGKIVKPEIGTYFEPDWVATHPDGSEITDQAEIVQNRLEFFATMGFATDNTLIQTYPLHGHLISMTETTFWNYHDPYTLETLGQLDLKQSKNFPEGMFCVTQTAHGHADLKTGDFYNVMGCMKLPGEGNLVPRVAYLPYKIVGAYRTSADMFVNPLPPQEFLDSIEFGEPFFNQHPTDLFLRYFHMMTITRNYIIAPLNALKIDFGPLLSGVLVDTLPLSEFMVFDDQIPGEFIVIDKSTMKALDKRFQTDPFLLLHAMNSYEDPDIPTNIIFDATATAGNVIEYYYYKYINSSGEYYKEMYEEMTPIGIPHRYTIDLEATPNLQGVVEVASVKQFEPSEDTDFPCFENGGLEFPTIDYARRDGFYYDHYWGCGFGEVLPDRLYHVQLSTKTRHVWQQTGYSPSEPVYIPNPLSDEEDEGVLVSIVSPYNNWDNQPFIVFLNAKDMTEIARGYLPKKYYIPVGFHSYWVSDDNVTV